MSSNSTNITEKEKAGQQRKSVLCRACCTVVAVATTRSLCLRMMRGWHLRVQADKVSSNSTNTTEKEKARQQTESQWYVGLATTVVAATLSL